MKGGEKKRREERNREGNRGRGGKRIEKERAMYSESQSV